MDCVSLGNLYLTRLVVATRKDELSVTVAAPLYEVVQIPGIFETISSPFRLRKPVQ